MGTISLTSVLPVKVARPLLIMLGGGSVLTPSRGPLLQHPHLHDHVKQNLGSAALAEQWGLLCMGHQAPEQIPGEEDRRAKGLLMRLGE